MVLAVTKERQLCKVVVLMPVCAEVPCEKRMGERSVLVFVSAVEYGDAFFRSFTDIIFECRNNALYGRGIVAYLHYVFLDNNHGDTEVSP